LVHAALPAVPALETVVVVGTSTNSGDWGRVRLLEFDELGRNDGDLELPQVRHSDVASIIYTSGTTGPAKGVLMPHAQVVLLARRTAEQCRLGPDDVVYCYLPMFHMAGKFMSVLGTMSAGGKVVLDDRFSADKWLERIRDCGATFTGGHGPMLEMIHALPATADDRRHSLRTICSAPFPKHIARSFQERFGVRGLEVWGMTEVGIPCWSSLDEPLHEGSCGRVDDEWFEFRIVDPETDEPLPPGETGEFVVRARRPFTLMQGYIGMPDKTVEAWRNMWFHTGDVGYVDASGLVYFVDRGSERIRRRAENISPYDIEVAALKHPAVAEAAAVGVPSGLSGDDDVKLCVVLRDGMALEAVDLLRHLAAELPHFMVPRYLEFVEALPRSATHKVQRAALKRPPFGADVWDRKQHGVALRDLVNGMSASPSPGAAGDN
jgi:crotonobetaine/carnitine-CoA ligase